MRSNAALGSELQWHYYSHQVSSAAHLNEAFTCVFVSVSHSPPESERRRLNGTKESFKCAAAKCTFEALEAEWLLSIRLQPQQYQVCPSLQSVAGRRL